MEINNTFYRLPKESTFDRWRVQVPPDFVYAVESSRYITHVRRLRDCAEPLRRFLSRARRLGSKLGPILCQYPRRWQPDLSRLEAFARLLPANLVHVCEFRDPRWFSRQILDVLCEHELVFCIYDMPGIDCPLEITAPAIYVRLHGAGELYSGNYDSTALRRWADRIQDWCQAGHEVWVCFNNDAFGHAVSNALTLKEMLG